MLPSYREVAEKAWLGGLSDGTPCGVGSTLANTMAIRELLPQIVARYGIRTVIDAGAGDMHWIRHVEWNVDYRPYDLVPRDPAVTQWDIATEILPACDLILCRFVIGHLDPASAVNAVRLIQFSGSKYLLASNPEHADYAVDRLGTFNKYDLSREPFSLGEPLEFQPDTSQHDICLWKLNG